ncbi:Sapep family Mn(2+)-dependent dipeptidase [Microvirga rosea]|uniref:Sapep family Mn(2+)-dependent dipeptidase n=1 Tax=Microvirga rosea TaxID=2715425 RepID=UPI001D0B1388|nr:Sapep family Mn(2+)-dependent dipeptidase [Microvirga rosea]MCB8821947.1 Sapep family Mn(2+)-dependent dipeptidase [Microvirga rosea]
MADAILLERQTGALTREEQNLLARIDAWFIAHRDEFIADLIAWVSIPSISDETAAAPGAPFGPQVARIFDHVARCAKELDFATESHDGYAISVFFGEGPQDIGLVSHLDVVPAGENWTVEPFEPFTRDGFVVGRGASDNKGPALLDLYLLRAFRDLGVKLKRRIRVIYGGAEETGMADMQYYAENAPVPQLSIISDGGFPVNFAQKGGLNLVLHIPTGPLLADFRAGVAENAVPATASLRLKGRTTDLIERLLLRVPEDLRAVLSLREDDGDAILVARGQSGHAAFPENTTNAILLLFRALILTGIVEGADLAATETVSRILQDPWGIGAGIAREDRDTGKLTLNGGIILPADGGFNLHIDIRYPISADAEELTTILGAAIAPVGGTLRVARHAKPVYIDRTSSLVELLQTTFDTIAGTQTEPFSMGGGTHARVLPRSITFGPGFGRMPDILFDGEPVNRRPDFIPDGHGSAHGPDEFVDIENLRRAFRVYAVALPRLDRWLDTGQFSDV